MAGTSEGTGPINRVIITTRGYHRRQGNDGVMAFVRVKDNRRDNIVPLSMRLRTERGFSEIRICTCPEQAIIRHR
jgi:hypothetical protein